MMKIWKVEIKPGHFSANALALLIVTLCALLLADYGYEASSMLRLAVVAVVTTIFSVLAFRYSQQDIPGLVVSWAAIICAMVVLLVAWAAYTYEVPFPVDTAVSYVVGPLSLVIFYVVFLYASFFVYHNFIEEEKEAEPAAAPFISRAAQAARAAEARKVAQGGPIEEGPVSKPPAKPARASAGRAARASAGKPASGARKSYSGKAPARKRAPAKRKAPAKRGRASKSAKAGKPARKRSSGK